MMVLKKTNLIPRNNWDYSWIDFLRSIYASTFVKKETMSNFEKLLGSRPVWTASGRAALYAILKAMDFPVGSKVGVPLYCCPVVFRAIREAGMIPVFIDSNRDDFNISSDDLRSKVNELSALVVVHVFGNPCDMDKIRDVAGGLPIIEDCAHSLYSFFKGGLTGTLANASFFSFRCGKYLSVGEAGIAVCGDAKLREKINSVVSGFLKPSLMQSVRHCFVTWIKALFYNRPLYGVIGYPLGRMLDKRFNLTAKDGFETALPVVGDVRLANRRISGFIHKVNIQKKHAARLLRDIYPAHAEVPLNGRLENSNAYLFPVLFEESSRRDAMAQALFARGVDTSRYLDDVVEVATADYGYDGNCPVAETLSRNTLLIPVNYRLTDRDLSAIVDCINEFD